MFLCQTINDIEWSGVLFIKKVEGELENPETLKFEAIDMYLMDIGSHTYTEFEYGPELVNAYDENEELMGEGVRTAMIHSHHNMPVYFSGTDVEELEDNTPEDVDMYLSLIVNNKFQWKCKIAVPGRRIVKNEVKSLMRKLGSKLFNETFQMTEKEERILYTIETQVLLEKLGSTQARVEEVKKLKAERAAEKARVAQVVAKNNTGGWQNTQSHNQQLIPYSRFNEDWEDVQKERTPLQKMADLMDNTEEAEEIPQYLSKLLLLSPDSNIDFEEAFNLVEYRFDAPAFREKYLKAFRKEYPKVLEAVKKLTCGDIINDDDFELEATVDLIDELSAWNDPNRIEVISGIIKILDTFIREFDGETITSNKNEENNHE